MPNGGYGFGAFVFAETIDAAGLYDRTAGIGADQLRVAVSEQRLVSAIGPAGKSNLGRWSQQFNA